MRTQRPGTSTPNINSAFRLLPAHDGHMEVSKALLPGVGACFALTTHREERIGVVTLRTGTVNVVRYSMTDPDACEVLLALNKDEAHYIAGLLTATHDE